MAIDEQLWVVKLEISKCSRDIESNLRFMEKYIEVGRVEYAEYLFSVAESIKKKMDTLIKVLESINTVAELDLIMAKKYPRKI